MRFAASVLLFFWALFAAPAWAEAPPRLHYLEQQLASIGAEAYTMAMVLGRLEIVSLFLLFTPNFWRR